MQGFRRFTLVVSLSAAIVVIAAATITPAAKYGHRSLDDNIITQILEFFGIELQSRFSIPPG